MADFSATLETAKGADATARLLQRAARRALKDHYLRDADELERLAGKYRDWADSLRAMVTSMEASTPDPDQMELI